MCSTRPIVFAAGLAVATTLALVPACDSRSPNPASSAPTPGPVAGSDTHDTAGESGHGPTTPLGEQVVDGFTVKASRDGDVKPGGDAPIDVWISGGSAKITAVRFWIGTEDAKGSVKARAEIERDNWHTHAEVPNPLPEGSRLWVEIEAEGGAKTIAGFDLAAT